MTTAAMTTNPYPGPRPFAQDESHLFFGREAELDDLFSLAVAHRVLLVYAQSGAGKTSLIQAGLVPRMLSQGFEVLPIARVGGMLPAGLVSSQVANVFTYSTLASWSGEAADPGELCRTDLAAWLRQEQEDNESSEAVPRVAIFDQFEELFTSHLDRWQDRRTFLEQLAAASEADARLRIVLVLREDFVARLDPFTEIFPHRLRIRFRLERLGRDAGLLAVTGPLHGSGVTFAPGVAEHLVDELMKERLDTGDGETLTILGEYIEPVQLQVVCHGLWTPDEPVITYERVALVGNIDRALASFYDEAVAASALPPGADEDSVREWCESELITAMGTRNTVYRAPTVSKGLPNEVLDALEHRHLIHAEWRAGARWYELSHDRFIDPIRASNRDYFIRRSQASERATHVVLEAIATNSLNHERALKLLETTLREVREIGDRRSEAMCLYGLGVVKQFREPERARDYFLQAIEVFEALGDRGSLVNTLGAVAAVYWSLEDFEATATTYSRLLELEPKPVNLQRRAAAYWYGEHLEAALADYDELIDLTPDDAGLLSERGQVLVELEVYDAAVHDLSAAVRYARSPAVVAYARAALGQALYMMGHHERGLQELADSIAAEPQNAWAYLRRAACHDSVGHHEDALEDYRRAVEQRNPPLTRGRRERAEARIAELSPTDTREPAWQSF